MNSYIQTLRELGQQFSRSTSISHLPTLQRRWKKSDLQESRKVNSYAVIAHFALYTLKDKKRSRRTKRGHSGHASLLELKPAHPTPALPSSLPRGPRWGVGGFG